ncbi:MAG TPA: MotA/TolQ/ExbB proton channel family protein [Gammaproteobacteria bacterium]
MSRAKFALASLGAGVAWIAVLSLILPIEPTNPNSVAGFLLDKTCATVRNNPDCLALIGSGRRVVESFFVYPFTIQVLMWLIFFVGLGELAFRWKEARVARRSLSGPYFSLEADAIIQPDDAAVYWRDTRDAAKEEAAFLPRLVHALAGQFQTSRSINQTNTLLNSLLDLMSHAIDVKYSVIRFIVWMLPTLGFIGTVYGLMIALGVVGGVDPDEFTSQAVNLFPAMIEGLSVAFTTTLLGLLQSAVIVTVMHFVQEREERALNDAGQSVIERFISKLYVKG